MSLIKVLIVELVDQSIENLKKLISVGSDDLGLRCVNGIKAIAMLFIVAGHSLLFMIGGPVKNSEFFEKVRRLLYWNMNGINSISCFSKPN